MHLVIIGLVLFFMFHKPELPKGRVKNSNEYSVFLTNQFDEYEIKLNEEMHTSVATFLYYIIDSNNMSIEAYNKEKDDLKSLGWRYIGVVSNMEAFCDKKNNMLSFKFPNKNAHKDDLLDKNWGVELIAYIYGNPECKLLK
ncbi:hypothetical protein BFG52_15325 [Acinetobacter larvae]|uniref:Uncharacterized protein n=2 Tax=Acinetobacter larvae TaxID=1789224 RepID=A0A1B2M304_9GAMM|nr:hypothetical protein BFG52_15325 [Acinetobacter larvae]